MEKTAVKPDAVLIPVAVVAYLGNILTVWWWNYPYLYCWGSPLASYVYLTVGYVFFYLMAGFFVWYMVKGQLTRATGAILLAVGLFELPRLFDMVFRLGGSCGT